MHASERVPYLRRLSFECKFLTLFLQLNVVCQFALVLVVQGIEGVCFVCRRLSLTGCLALRAARSRCLGRSPSS